MYDIIIWKYESGIANYTCVEGKLNEIAYVYRNKYKNDHTVRMIQIYESHSGELVMQFGA